MKKLRICMVIDYYYPVVGGCEVQAYRLVNILSKMGQGIFIVTRKISNLKLPKTINNSRVYKIPVFGQKRLASILFLTQIFLFLIKYKNKYNVIHCHLATSTTLSCILAGWLTRTPVLIKLGGSGKTGDIQTSLSTRAGRIKLGLLNRSSCYFIAPCQDIANEMINTGFDNKRIHIIPNGVDTEYFSSASCDEKRRRKHGLGIDGKKLVLYIGRLEPDKGIIPLIDSWGRLKPENWILWIIGSGRLEGTIKAKIKELGIEKKTSLFPSILPEKVRDYLQIGDLFINPSKYEGISNSILEAMSCEIPVIAARIGGNIELIKDCQNGFLFSSGDIYDLTRTIIKALAAKKERERIGKNGRKWVIENLDLKLIANLYIKLYNKILSPLPQ